MAYQTIVGWVRSVLQKQSMEGPWSTVSIDLLELKKRFPNEAEEFFRRVQGFGSPYGAAHSVRIRENYRRRYGSKWLKHLTADSIRGYVVFYLRKNKIDVFMRVAEIMSQ